MLNKKLIEKYIFFVNLIDKCILLLYAVCYNHIQQ